MKATRTAKAGKQNGKPKRIISKLAVAPQTLEPTWQSVIADAEQLMAELRRTIEWARQSPRRAVSCRGDSATHG